MRAQRLLGKAVKMKGIVMSTVRTGLARMARLNDGTMSFGASFALGLALHHLFPTKPPLYNGAGRAGDLRAVEQDFSTAFAAASRKHRSTATRG